MNGLICRADAARSNHCSPVLCKQLSFDARDPSSEASDICATGYLREIMAEMDAITQEESGRA